MARNRVLAFLTALCLLLSVFPVHTHALEEDPLEQMYHDRCQQDATRQVRGSERGPWLIAPKGQAVLPAGAEDFLIEDTFADICQWAIDAAGWLYIWCKEPMPVRSSPEEYPWNAYRHLYSMLYIDSPTVADYAFAGGSNLGLVQLDKKTTAIGEAAFANCTGLEEFWFYGPAPSIASNAFSSVNAVLLYHWSDTSYDSLTNQSFGGSLYWTTWLDALANGMLGTVEWFVCEDMSLRLYGAGSAMTNLAAPEDYPWNDWRGSITSLFCENVTHLGNFALADCPGLNYAEFDSALNSIGDGAFRGCDGLTLSFAGSAPSLGKEAFTDDGLTLEYPQDDPTWTDAAIDRFYGIETPSVEPGKITCGITAQQVYDAMIALKPQYPEGMHWTNDNYYAWNGGDFTGGYGCAGFAFILSDAAFGTEPSRRITENITIDDVRVGDILRINNDTHSVIVLEVYEDHVVVAEGNFNSSIHWGRTFDADKIASVTDYIMTRYPEHDWSSHSCLEARSCAKCGTHEEAPGHRWVDATCSKPKTCKACGMTEGQPLEHSWMDATCSSPQTCSLCKMTLGEPTGKHVFTGAGDSSCNVCGYIRDIGDIPPTESLCPLPEEALEFLRRINQQRAAAGLNPLTTPETLYSAANARAQELLVLFGHTRPNGESWSSLLKEANIPYSTCTENISRGYSSASKAFESWFGNSSHLSLFLDPDFGYAALAFCEDAYVEIFTDAEAYSQIRVDVPDAVSFPTGTPIEHMGLVAVLRSSAGDCWLPLTSAYCPGYNPELSGAQTVTVSVLGVTCSFTLTLEGEAADHTHSWTAATCETAQICTECGQSEGAPLGHQWNEATCQSPKTCGRCGAAEGAPTGIHTYTDDADISCNVCGQLREVEIAPGTVPLSAFELEVLRLTNLERLAQGLNPLTATAALQQATDIRAEEIRAYFSHTRPNGTECFTILDELGIRYGAAAENIAAGYGTPAAVMTGWMNSPGHRDNILTPALGHMGVGELSRSWVQLFTSAPAYSDIRVTVPEGASFKPGIPLDDLGLVAVLRNSNGDCWLPLASAFCTGYDPNTPGTQTVTVSVLGVTCTFALTLEGHTHTWMDATCETPQTCSECGKAEGAPLGHNWVAATCEAPKTCDLCGKTEGAAIGHSWVDATCEAPKTCDLCGKADGSALGHDWNAASCEAPKTCNRCGKTEGSAVGHSWKDATCEAPKTCDLCGKTEGYPKAHTYADGVCTGCGQSQYAVSGRQDRAAPTREQIAEAFRAITSASSVFDLTPSVSAPYAAGKLSDSLLQSGITYLNFIRFVANLPAQQLDSTLNEDAQHAAVLIAANNTMSHTPTKPADMDEAFYNRGYAAASSSNLYHATGYNALSILSDALQCFMDDNIGTTNLQRVGHRRWILNPTLLNVGLGYATSASGSHYVAMKVFDRSGDAVDYDFVAWPANNFPTNLISASVPWSVSLNPGKYRTPDIQNIRVTLTRRSDGKSWTFDSTQPYLFVDGSGRGSGPCIVFHPGAFVSEAYSGVYEVRITGLQDQNGAAAELTYLADFFALETPHEHSFTAQVVAPSCTEEGYTVHTCGCGHFFTDTYTDPLGHDWNAASCEAPGTCKRCGKTEGNAVGHSWKDATCEAPRTCSACGKTDGSALGHDWNAASCEAPGTCKRCGKAEGSAVGHSWKDATCETPKTCSACGKTDGSALGHDWNAASCEAPGTCKRCGKTEGNAVGHSWKDATCEAPKTCDLCGKTEGSALGHSWKGPTCEEPKTCTRCSKTEGSPLLHAWDNGTVTQQPTFDQEGLKVYTCMDCGDTRTEPIPVLQNPFTAIDKPDTVLPYYDFSYDIPKDGATVLIFFSSLCGNSISLMRQLNGCDWMANPWLEVVAIETKVGTAEAVAEFRDTYTPDVKDHILYYYTQSNDMQFDYFRLFSSENRLTWPLVMVITGTEEAPVVRYGAQAMTNPNALESILSLVSPAFAQWDGTAHEHTWVDATCLAPKTCSACGKTEGAALGHDWKPASCETAKTCARCGQTEGSAIGHSWVDATCQTPKTCSACGKTEGKALGHSWNAASCETAKTCARCGQTEGSAAGHSWVDATCQTPKTCSACGKTEGYPIDHNFVDGKCGMCGIQERKAGDADGNGVLNYSDALLILRASIGLETLPQEILDICDVSGDGIANYSDALLILRFSIGLITEFPSKK